MIVKSVIKNGEKIVQIKVSFTDDEISAVRSIKLESYGDDFVDLVNDYIRDGDMDITFLHWCDIAYILLYRRPLTFDECRNLNIILNDKVRISHRYFDYNGWMELSGTRITFENGYEISVEKYFSCRKGELYKTGYLLKEEMSLEFLTNYLEGLLKIYERVNKNVYDIETRYYKYFEDLKFKF